MAERSREEMEQAAREWARAGALGGKRSLRIPEVRE